MLFGFAFLQSWFLFGQTPDGDRGDKIRAEEAQYALDGVR